MKALTRLNGARLGFLSWAAAGDAFSCQLRQLHSRMRRFPAAVAQLVEQRIRNAKVASSIPASGTRESQEVGVSEEAAVRSLFYRWKSRDAHSGRYPGTGCRERCRLCAGCPMSTKPPNQLGHLCKIR